MGWCRNPIRIPPLSLSMVDLNAGGVVLSVQGFDGPLDHTVIHLVGHVATHRVRLTGACLPVRLQRKIRKKDGREKHRSMKGRREEKRREEKRREEKGVKGGWSFW